MSGEITTETLRASREEFQPVWFYGADPWEAARELARKGKLGSPVYEESFQITPKVEKREGEDIEKIDLSLALYSGISVRARRQVVVPVICEQSRRLGKIVSTLPLLGSDLFTKNSEESLNPATLDIEVAKGIIRVFQACGIGGTWITLKEAEAELDVKDNQRFKEVLALKARPGEAEEGYEVKETEKLEEFEISVDFGSGRVGLIVDKAERGAENGRIFIDYLEKPGTKKGEVAFPRRREIFPWRPLVVFGIRPEERKGFIKILALLAEKRKYSVSRLSQFLHTAHHGKTKGPRVIMTRILEAAGEEVG